jgi:DNA-binding NarL/FixJ family response regulator
MLRIAIVDDHQLFRKSLALLISTFEGINVAIEAKNGKEFIDALEEIPVDLVLLDIQMPEMDGYETCKILHELHPNIKILIVSQLTTKESIHKIMDLGAHGYFTKNSNPEHLEFAIKSLSEKGFYFGMELGEVLREAILWEKKAAKKVVDSTIFLSKRELEIIVMASQELSSAEIAHKLCINLRTVETHRKRVMEKTKTKNFIGVVLFALKHNYIALDDI